MTFSIEQAMELFFNNSGGGGIAYGGTSQGGTITGNPTGGTGTGSSYPESGDSGTESSDSESGDSGTSTSAGGDSDVLYDENGDPIYIDFEVAPTTWTWTDNTDYVTDRNYVLDIWNYFIRDSSENWTPAYLAMEWRSAWDFQFSLNRPPAETDEVYPETGGVDVQKGFVVVQTGATSWTAVATSLGTSGNDFFQGSGLLYGYTGNDTIIGNWQSDMLLGGTGSDILNGREGRDILDGGEGLDFANYWNSSVGVFVSLASPEANTGEAAGDVFVSIEGLEGSQQSDTLVGNGQANVLRGLTGDDTLNGREGADTLEGGEGRDIASYANADAGVTASLGYAAENTGEAAGDVYASIEGLSGSAHNDVLIGDGNGNVLMGLGSNDVLAGRDGHDQLQGGDGDDVLIGGTGGDTLGGGAGFDHVEYAQALTGVTANLGNAALNTGEAAGDLYIHVEGLTGSYHNDRLTGNSGDNSLLGLSGHDTLSGGGGNDRLYGWEGYDTFVLDGAGVDLLGDFKSWEDTIQLDRAVFGSAGPAGTLAASAFSIGTGATTAQQRIVYNQGTGELFYDMDGSGWIPKLLIATVQPYTTLTAGDFFLV